MAAAVAISLSLNPRHPLGPEAVPDRELSLEQLPALRGQRDVAHAPVLGAAPALDDVRGLELIEDRGDRGGRQLGALGQLAGGHLVLAAERGDRPNLREGQLARPAVVAATEPAIGGEQVIAAPCGTPRACRTAQVTR